MMTRITVPVLLAIAFSILHVSVAIRGTSDRKQRLREVEIRYLKGKDPNFFNLNANDGEREEELPEPPLPNPIQPEPPLGSSEHRDPKTSKESKESKEGPTAESLEEMIESIEEMAEDMEMDDPEAPGYKERKRNKGSKTKKMKTIHTAAPKEHDSTNSTDSTRYEFGPNEKDIAEPLYETGNDEPQTDRPTEGDQPPEATTSRLIPSFAIRYTVDSSLVQNQDRVPLPSDYNEVVRVTNGFLSDYLEEFFSSTEANHAFTIVPTFTIRDPWVIELEVTSHFFVPGEVPTNEMLYTTLENAFAPSSESLREYMEDLHGMSTMNPFSMSTEVEVIDNRADAAQGSNIGFIGSNDGTSKPPASKRRLLIPMLLALLGSMVLASALYLNSKNRRVGSNTRDVKEGTHNKLLDASSDSQIPTTVDDLSQLSGYGGYGPGCFRSPQNHSFSRDDRSLISIGKYGVDGAQTLSESDSVSHGDFEDVSLDDDLRQRFSEIQQGRVNNLVQQQDLISVYTNKSSKEEHMAFSRPDLHSSLVVETVTETEGLESTFYDDIKLPHARSEDEEENQNTSSRNASDDENSDDGVDTDEDAEESESVDEEDKAEDSNHCQTSEKSNVTTGLYRMAAGVGGELPFSSSLPLNLEKKIASENQISSLEAEDKHEKQEKVNDEHVALQMSLQPLFPAEQGNQVAIADVSDHERNIIKAQSSSINIPTGSTDTQLENSTLSKTKSAAKEAKSVVDDDTLRYLDLDGPEDDEDLRL